MFASIPLLDHGLRAGLLIIMALIWVVMLIRLNGLRSLSKMTSFDFVMTIALGSLVASASQSTSWLEFTQPLGAMLGLFLAQWAMARLRQRWSSFDALQNRPAILMLDGEVLHDALKRTRVAESDLLAKLREANVLDIAQVRAVILETTGDVSVLHGDHLEAELISGVCGAPKA